MRYFVILYFLFLFLCSPSYAQDVIYLQNGTKVEGKVLEVGEETVIYKKKDNPDGPDFVIRKDEVLVITYQNGSFDVFSLGKTDHGGDRFHQIPHSSLSCNLLDFMIGGVTLSYEFLSKGNEGRIGYAIPVSVLVEQPLYQTGIDMNFYPTGQKKASYFLGPKVRIGYSDSFFLESSGFFASVFVNNGVVFSIENYARISLCGAVGLYSFYLARNVRPIVSLNLNFGFRF